MVRRALGRLDPPDALRLTQRDIQAIAGAFQEGLSYVDLGSRIVSAAEGLLALCRFVTQTEPHKRATPAKPYREGLRRQVHRIRISAGIRPLSHRPAQPQSGGTETEHTQQHRARDGDIRRVRDRNLRAVLRY